MPRLPLIWDPNDHSYIAIELQGILDANSSVQASERSTLGEIEFYEKGRASLTIGNHKLEGNVIQLKNPLAVVIKNTFESIDEAADGERMVEYHVVSLVRKKVLFKTRPQLMLGSSLAEKKQKT